MNAYPVVLRQPFFFFFVLLDSDHRPPLPITAGHPPAEVIAFSREWVIGYAEQVEAAIVAAKKEKPHWGARKIRDRLLRRLPHAIKIPAASTVHAVLDRHGLVTRMKRFRTRAQGTALSEGVHPNDLWCADYKGEFQLGNRQYCYPLTVTDHASRYLLLCEALESTREELALRAFDRLFRERGLPAAIRSDNGVPFASPHGLFQLSRLSVWWL